jgi:hypothetical protein
MVLEVMYTSVYAGLNPITLLLSMGRGSIFLGPLYALLQARHISLAPTFAIAVLTTKSTYRSLSAQRLSERTVEFNFILGVKLYT